MYTNKSAKDLKGSIRNYFSDFDSMLAALWNGLKAEDATFKALNDVIAGIAGGDGLKPYQWLIANFSSRYFDIDGNPLKKVKQADGTHIYKPMQLNGVTARGTLKRSALNAIESQRNGNTWKVVVID
jgi:hypothetical protein